MFPMAKKQFILQPSSQVKRIPCIPQDSIISELITKLNAFVVIDFRRLHASIRNEQWTQGQLL